MNGTDAPPVWSAAVLGPIVWQARVQLLAAAAGVAILTLVINLLLPPTYRSTAKLLPEGERPRVQVVSQLAELARLAGAGGAQADPGRLYPVLLTSDGLLRTAAVTRYPVGGAGDSADLRTVFGLDSGDPEQDLQDAVVRLRDRLTVQYDARSGVVTASLGMQDPYLAAAVLETLVRELDVFMRSKRKTVAAEQRRWIEGRLTDIRRELRAAEEALTRFREKNRRVADSPELLLDQERLLRDVDLKAGILVELTRQHELARIEEIKDIGMVNVLDQPRPASRREGPRRTANTLLAFAGTLGAGILLLGARAAAQRRTSGP